MFKFKKLYVPLLLSAAINIGSVHASSAAVLGGVVDTDYADSARVSSSSASSSSLSESISSSWVAESVDKQVDAWEKVHKAKRAITDFSNVKTNLPPLLDRIAYMAGYVRNAIAGIKEREDRANAITQEAKSLCKSGKLTFQEATRLFGDLAVACDKTVSLSKLVGLNYSELYCDIAFLCIPEGGLKISRFVDGYLRNIPLVFMALPNQPQENGPHCNHFKEVLQFYSHESGHLPNSFSTQWLNQSWPLHLEKITAVRNQFKPGSKERNYIDVLLFDAFHERQMLPYNLPEIKISQRRKTHLEFDCADMKNLATFLKGKEVISNEAFFGTLDAANKCLKFESSCGSGKEQQVPCAFLSSVDPNVETVVAELMVCDQLFKCRLYGFKRHVDSVADVIYLLKYAGVTTLSDGKTPIPVSITVDNAEAVVERFNQFVGETSALLLSHINGKPLV